MIPLSELIAEVRKDLFEARGEGMGREPRFVVEEAELELNVVVTRGVGGDGKLNLGVFSLGADSKADEQQTQKIRLKLKPVGPDDRDYKVSDRGRE
jgi:hypothetical protein